MDERILHIQHCMYQYSRAIYRSIKDLIDPYVDEETQLEYRREVLQACEGTMQRLAQDPHYFAKPDRALFQDIRRYFPITVQAQVAWAVNQGVDAAVSFVEEQIEAGAVDGARHQIERRGIPGDERRSIRPALLLRSRGACVTRRPARLTARRVHGRGAVHVAFRAVLPAGARARRRGACRAADLLLPPRR